MAQPIPVIWDFDKQNFVKMAGSGGGTSFTAEGSGIPPDQLTADNKSSTGLAIIKTITSKATVIIDANLENIELGTLSIDIRMRISNITYVGNVLMIKTHYMKNASATKQLLTTTYVSASDFNVSNVYQNIGFICNFNGDSGSEKLLNIVISTVAGYSGTIGFDYVKASTALAGIYSLPTVQS